MTFRTAAFLILSIPSVLMAQDKPSGGDVPIADRGKGQSLKKVSPEMKAALEKLALPGVKINVEEWCVDVEATVCLRQGLLELIACTKDSKEHESIIVIGPKPSHVHTALLLLRAKPGHPAMQKPIDPEGRLFMPVPPSGDPIGVFLVIKDAEGKETEHPISDFIAPAEREDENPGGAKPEKFPTHTFLFAGSIIEGQGEGARKYACDGSGNVISIATFGDELLCLPDIYDQSDGSLMWEVDGEKLPALGAKVILRLRPRIENPPAPQKQDKPAVK